MPNVVFAVCRFDRASDCRCIKCRFPPLKRRATNAEKTSTHKMILTHTFAQRFVHRRPQNSFLGWAKKIMDRGKVFLIK